MTDTGLGDSPTAVQCPLCPNWARSDSWHIRHAERIRELEAELADAIRIREVNRKLSDDWMARAEKAEARVAELEKAIRSALGEIGDFPGIPEDWPRRPFYWRTWLRQLSGIVFEGERK